MKHLLGSFVALLLLNLPSRAVQTNSLFSDNMVLPRDQPVVVWGTGEEGENVTVTIAGESASTAAHEGKWTVTLPALAASSTPVPFQVSGKNTVTLNNVLVGDVWVCSGQSNMERLLGPKSDQVPIDNWEQEAASADLPLIRQFHIPAKGTTQPVDDVRGKWTVCTPVSVLQFSAVGFFFARALQKDIGVPVGILFTSVGGTTAEQWTPKAALLSRPETAGLVQDFDRDVQAYPALFAQWKAESPALIAKYAADTAALPPGSKPLPNKPQPPRDPSNSEPGRLYNAMVLPLIPYGVRGVVWYQGESNGGRAAQYRVLLPMMISEWRQAWKQPELPFLIVQLPKFSGIKPDLREAQQMTVNTVPHTAMVVTTDLGEEKNLHPPHKRPVGERLALAARTLVYGEKIESSGPVFAGVDFANGQAVIKFTHTVGGLVAKIDPLAGFQIAGSDKKFVNAEAHIQGDTIVVSSPSVPTPAFIRYDWANVPNVSLYNQAGLPAAPFRTDTD